MKDDFNRFRRPSTERYAALIKGLEDVDKQLANGMPALEAAIYSVDLINIFLAADPQVQQRGTSNSLRRLLGSLHDVAIGSKPPMFFSGGLINIGKPGRRTSQTFDNLRACLAAALTFLIESGMKNAVAASKLEDMLRQAKVTHKGQPIMAKRLLQWREQINDTSPAQVNDMYAKILDNPLHRPLTRSIQHAEKAAASVVDVVRRWA